MPPPRAGGGGDGGNGGWPLESIVDQVGGLFKGKPEEAPVGSTVAGFSLASTSGAAVQVPAEGAACSVVFFFNKSDTPGCSAEADEFDKLAGEFSKRGAQLVGVSMEDVAALQESNAGRSSVELLSDDGGAVSKALGAELNIPLLGKFSARQTFLLSPGGEVVAKWKEGKNMSSVKTPEHAREVLAAIDAAGLAK